MIKLKPIITIEGCTDKTCRDCNYLGHYNENESGDFGCSLYQKKLNANKDKAYKFKEEGIVFDDYTRLKECLEAEAAANYQRIWRQKRKEQGLCIWCGAPVMENKDKCRACSIKAAEVAHRCYVKKHKGAKSHYDWRENGKQN